MSLNVSKTKQRRTKNDTEIKSSEQRKMEIFDSLKVRIIKRRNWREKQRRKTDITAQKKEDHN